MTFLHPLALLGLAAAAIPALLHLLERRIPPEVRYRDPESAASVVVRPRELARAYRATVRREIDAWRTACRRHGIAYHHILTDMPFGMALRLLA